MFITSLKDFITSEIFHMLNTEKTSKTISITKHLCGGGKQLMPKLMYEDDLMGRKGQMCI